MKFQLLAFTVFSLAISAGQAADRPNVLLIVADDQGFADFGFMGLRDDVKTPHLDQLAKEGTVLTQAYATSAICSPARMGLTTGRYQARFGAYHYGGARALTSAEAEKTLPARLQKAGYRTAHFGKHHFVGSATKTPGQIGFPLQLGYDRFFGSVGGRIHYLHHSDALREDYGHPFAILQMALGTMWDNDRAVDDWEGFTTDDWTDRAIEFIDQETEDPFFILLAYNAVHNFAWQLPEAELKKRNLPTFEDLKLPATMSKKEAGAAYMEWYARPHRREMPEGRGWYLAQLELMDSAIGRLSDHLEKSGISDNTIIIYTIDNGGCTPDWAENGPLAGGKYHLLEGGTRTLTIVKYPGRVANAYINDSLVFSALDIAPTLLQWCGVPYEENAFDGISQVKSLSEKDSGFDSERVLHWDLGFQWSVRSGKWKLMKTIDEKASQRISNTEQIDIRSGIHLYNLEDDPGETRNLADQSPEIVERLTRLHVDWRAEVGSKAE
tara:strand:- start:4072 stop:5559 length:1488 start_codon:yes stop_codon:yes gene_type:complete